MFQIYQDKNKFKGKGSDWVDSNGKKVPYIDWLHSHDKTAKHQFAKFLQHTGKIVSSNQDSEHHTFCMQDIT